MFKAIAIGITPRINTDHRDRIREWLDGVHPLSSAVNYEDTGMSSPRKGKLVHVDQSGAGPNEITREDGDKSSGDNLSSGYNRGLDPGGRADDETGPGNSTQVPETDSKEISRIFMTEKEINNFLFMNDNSNKLDQKSRANLSNVFRGQTYGPAPRSSSWQYAYN